MATKAKTKSGSDKAVVIHGPQGCGKTKNADALCKHYGKSHAVDYEDHVHGAKGLPADAIVFLHEPNPNFPQAIAFDEAMRAAGLAD